jgi:hypothetical protein
MDFPGGHVRIATSPRKRLGKAEFGRPLLQPKLQDGRRGDGSRRPRVPSCRGAGEGLELQS